MRTREALVERCRRLPIPAAQERLARALAVFGEPFRKREHAHGRITPEYIAYNREDVWATAALYERQMQEHVRHPIELSPERSYSPASVGKAYLRALGVRPPLRRQPGFPKDVLGYATAAYYGGRAECRTRRTPVPVTYVDFLAMYATICSLLGLWQFLTCTRVEIVEENREDVEAWLDGLRLDDCFDPATWPRLRGLVLIEPAGDVLPVRARYEQGGSFGIGLNPLESSPEPLWYTLPDALAARRLGRRAPKVVRALRFVPKGRSRRLRRLELRGAVPIDPHAQDFFLRVIEERKSLPQRSDLSASERARLAPFLKVLANATSYGIFAEMNRQELGGGGAEPVTVYGLDSFAASDSSPEQAGEFFFSPLACLIAGGARLMLALLERLVTDAGGSYAFCDTDSMAIAGLSEAEEKRIVTRFEQLNAYDRELVPGSILEVERENFEPDTGERQQLHCYAISAKRYCMFTLDERGEPILRKWSEHGLGHLLNPIDPDADARDLVKELWDFIVRVDALGLPAQEPSWLDRPAVSRLTVSKPGLLRPFAGFNEGKPASDRVRPFNFLLAAHVPAGGHPAGVDPERFQLVAPYNSDPRQWRKLAWTDVYSGRRYRITASGQGSDGVARVKSWRDVLDEYRVRPEAKSLGPDGRPCGRDTIGLLRRRPVAALSITHVGKESNLLEEVQAGLVHDEDEVLTVYRDEGRDPWPALVHPLLVELPVRHVADSSGLSANVVEKLRGGHSKRNRPRVTPVVADHAREQLRAWGMTPPRGDLAACAAYRQELSRRGLGKACAGCRRSLTDRQRRWCSDRCRKRSSRAS
jgi:hypothetical protein